MITAPDRLQQLLDLAQVKVTGIDYIYVHPDQQQLDVYFLRSPLTLSPPLEGDLTGGQILIYGASDEAAGQQIPVSLFSWVDIGTQRVLHLETEYPGDFRLYKLRLDNNKIDPFYNNVTFSFKANCPSDLDCEPPAHECPPETPVDFPVDYLARDFWSFRQALLDFASQRYPDWNDRLEADAGVMLAEVMSALGDEMAYYQDRVGREAYLETATQGRSLQHHAQLIDYTVHQGLGASTWLDVTVTVDLLDPDPREYIPAGLAVWATSDSGQHTYYEVGKGVAEIAKAKTYLVDYRRNSFDPHIWDEDDACLPVGATSLYIEDHQGAVLTPFDDLTPGKDPGKWILLQTTPDDPAIPARVHLVRVVRMTETTDPVFNSPITLLEWEEGQALPFEMNMTFLAVRANLVPVTAGRHYTSFFVVGAGPEALGLPAAATGGMERALERQGHDNSVAYLFSLPGSETDNLVWQGVAAQAAWPDMRLVEMVYNGGTSTWTEFQVWEWKRSFLMASSQGQDTDFTLEAGTWKRVKGFQRPGQEIVHKDYAAAAGMTIRFGEGAFGLTPNAKTVFKVDYRLGGGQQGNLGAGSIRQFTNPGFIDSVRNPLAATNGQDPEPAAEIRQLAPEAFRAVAYRAVRPEDYAEAAGRLPWVQRAGAVFRWTGSWLSAFVTPDPLGSPNLSADRYQELVAQLDRFRQAGREAHVRAPVYASMDLVITVCVASTAYPGEVQERVLEVLFGKKGLRPIPGYFSPDRFTFGSLLERSTLEAAIQSVSGVRAVEQIIIRRRSWFNWRVFDELFYDPGMNTILQVENDPVYPERGTLKLKMKGGA